MPGKDRPAPTCPRCNYDQSGVAATWKEACPLAGTCSECGTAFEWGDVFDHDRGRVRGFYEHAVRWRRWVWWSQVTFAWTLVPAVFWRRVGAEEPRLRRRVWVWPLLASAPAWAVGALAITLQWCVGVLANPGPWRFHWMWLVNSWTEPIGRCGMILIDRTRWGWGFRFQTDWLPVAGAGMSLWLAWLLTLWLIAVLPRGPRWPRAWLVRAAVYSLAWLPALAIVRMAEALWWLGIRVADAVSGRQLSQWFWSPNDVLPHAGPVAMFFWLAAWWWCALARLLGRREALRFWVAGVVFGGIAATLIDAMIRIKLAQAP